MIIIVIFFDFHLRTIFLLLLFKWDWSQNAWNYSHLCYLKTKFKTNQVVSFQRALSSKNSLTIFFIFHFSVTWWQQIMKLLLTLHEKSVAVPTCQMCVIFGNNFVNVYLLKNTHMFVPVKTLIWNQIELNEDHI